MSLKNKWLIACTSCALLLGIQMNARAQDEQAEIDVVEQIEEDGVSIQVVVRPTDEDDDRAKKHRKERERREAEAIRKEKAPWIAEEKLEWHREHGVKAEHHFESVMHELNRAHEETAHRIHRLHEALEVVLEAGDKETAEQLEKHIKELKGKIGAIEEKREHIVHRHEEQIEEQHRRRHHEDDDDDDDADEEKLLLRLLKGQHETREQLLEASHEITLLHRKVAELQKVIEDQHRNEHDRHMSEVDLSGYWLMTLPVGKTVPVKLSRREDDLLHLQSKTVLAGMYRHDGSELRVILPDDKRLTQFVWKIRDENSLLLVESSTDTGSDYTGAVMKRIDKSTVQETVGKWVPKLTEESDIELSVNGAKLFKPQGPFVFRIRPDVSLKSVAEDLKKFKKTHSGDIILQVDHAEFFETEEGEVIEVELDELEKGIEFK